MESRVESRVESPAMINIWPITIYLVLVLCGVSKLLHIIIFADDTNFFTRLVTLMM